MAAGIQINEMTVSEKIAAMEALWESLSTDPSYEPSPPWHGEVLAAREKNVREGTAKLLDWDECKKALREAHC